MQNPSSPAQYCTVANGYGAVGNGPVTNIAVTCTTRHFHPVGGTISGVEGTGLQLRLISTTTGYTTLDIAPGTTSFSFPAELEGAPYAEVYEVVVLQNPSSPAQYCTVANGYGAVGTGPVTNIAVTCTTQ
jgi:hypothetical protein